MAKTFWLIVSFGDVVWWVGMACPFRSGGRTLSPESSTMVTTTRPRAGASMKPPGRSHGGDGHERTHDRHER
jgi:hypothetical protein